MCAELGHKATDSDDEGERRFVRARLKSDTEDAECVSGSRVVDGRTVVVIGGDDAAGGDATPIARRSSRERRARPAQRSVILHGAVGDELSLSPFCFSITDWVFSSAEADNDSATAAAGASSAAYDDGLTDRERSASAPSSPAPPMRGWFGADEDDEMLRCVVVLSRLSRVVPSLGFVVDDAPRRQSQLIHSTATPAVRLTPPHCVKGGDERRGGTTRPRRREFGRHCASRRQPTRVTLVVARPLTLHASLAAARYYRQPHYKQPREAAQEQLHEGPPPTWDDILMMFNEDDPIPVMLINDDGSESPESDDDDVQLRHSNDVGPDDGAVGGSGGCASERSAAAQRGSERRSSRCESRANGPRRRSP